MDAYFDMFSGISGNMVLGALLDLGLDLDDLLRELDKLGLSSEYNIITKKVIKEGITGTYVNVELLGVDDHSHMSDDHEQDNKHINHEHKHEHECEHNHNHNHNHNHDHDHDHDHDHEAHTCKHKDVDHAEHCHENKGEHICNNKDMVSDNHDHSDSHGHKHQHGRNLTDINTIIDTSSLSVNVKEKSKNIFLNLAKAEAKIHGTDIDKIHFHEVGAVDAIVDIVGSVIGMELLGIKRVFASRIHTGTGFVQCQHGKMPLPAPATMELLSGVPIYSTGIKSELVTPTGAAIITTLAESFAPRPDMEIKVTGYGAGSRDLEIPNLLRVNTGRFNLVKSEQGGVKKKYNEDSLTILETNIDDMNPEYYQHIIEKLLASGALDVYLTPIQMKKNRPAVKLSVLIDSKAPGVLEKSLNIIFMESSSLGIRIFENITRVSLDRKVLKVQTPWGEVRIKKAFLEGKLIKSTPEYEDCKQISDKQEIPLIDIYNYIIKTYN